MRIEAALCSGLLVSALMAQTPCGHEFRPGLPFPGASMSVVCSTWWDPDGNGPQPGQLIVGGAFGSIGGVPALGIASYDPASGGWSALGSGFAYGPTLVGALLPLPSGGLLVGGTFTLAGGLPHGGVVHWDGSQWSTLGTDMFGNVAGLARLPNGDILAAGQLYVGAGAAMQRSPIASWNGSVWSIPGGGMTPDYETARMTQFPNGEVLLTGRFTAPFADRAVWNGSTWSPAPTLGNGFVDSLAVAPNGDVVATGTFSVVAGLPANGIVRWNGQSWSLFGQGFVFGPASGSVATCRFLANGDLVVAGRFAQIAGVAAANVARWNGTAWTPLGFGIGDGLGIVPPYPAGVATLTVLPNGSLFAGGSFSNAGDVVTQHAALWDGSEWTAASGGSNGTVLAVQALRGGDVVAGGYFTVLGAGAARGIARWDGSAWRSLGTGMRGPTRGATSSVAAITECANGDLVAVGDFTSAGGVAAANVARWNGASWSALGSGLAGGNGFGPVATCVVELPNHDLVVGGYFATAGGVAANGIARWDGSAWSPMGTGVSSSFYPKVSSMVVMPNGDLVVAGSFLAIDGVPANHIARWDGATWSPLGSGFGSYVGTEVYDLLVRGNGELVAVGAFSTAGGVAAAGLARWNGSAWAAFGAALPGQGYALDATATGDLLVAGAIQNSAGVHALARWDGTAWSVVESRIVSVWATPNAYALSLAVPADGSVHFGGPFHFTGAYQPTPHLAQVVSTCPAAVQPRGNGCVGSAGPVALAATSLPWLGGTHTARATGAPPNSVALVAFGLQPLALPLASLLPQGGPNCTLLVAPEVLELQFPNQGVVATALALPNLPAFVGVTLREQVGIAELDPLGAVGLVTSSNALDLTLGVF